MSISKKIKKKATDILNNFEEKDLFGVSIDDCENTDTSDEVIPPGDDGYED